MWIVVLCVFKRHRGKLLGKKLQIPFAAPDAFLGVLKGWFVTTALEIVIKSVYRRLSMVGADFETV